jgi:hypothetical protein
MCRPARSTDAPERSIAASVDPDNPAHIADNDPVHPEDRATTYDQLLRAWVGGHNAEAKRELEGIISESVRPPTGPLDAAFIAARDEDEALYFAAKLRSRVVLGGQLWVANLASRGLAAALAHLGYAESGMSLRSGNISLVGFVLQSPTT